MTVPVQTPLNQYTAAGGNDTFAFTFRILTDDDLVVRVDNALQTKDVDYTVQDVTQAGGNVVFTAAPIAGQIVVIQRDTTIDQQVDYQPFDPFPAETHELALDKLTLITQELDEFGVTVDQDLTISGAWEFVTGPTLANGVPLRGKLTNDIELWLVGITNNDALQLGSNSATNVQVRAATSIGGYLSDVLVINLVDRASGSLLVYDRLNTARKAGYRNPPVTFASSDRALEQNDEGAAVVVSGSGRVLTAPQLEQSTEMKLFVASNATTVNATGGAQFTGYDANGTVRPTGTTLTLVAAAWVHLFWRAPDNIYVYGNGFTIS